MQLGRIGSPTAPTTWRTPSTRGIVDLADLPEVVRRSRVPLRRQQLADVHQRRHRDTRRATGVVGMDKTTAEALGELRRFNYERIYTRPESVAQSMTVVRVLRDLVNYYLERPEAMPDEYRHDDLVRGAVTYVGGMTDRFAFENAQRLLGWDPKKLPRGIGRGA